MFYILGWVVFGFLLAVMVVISVATIRLSKEPSPKKAKERRKTGEDSKVDQVKVHQDKKFYKGGRKK